MLKDKDLKEIQGLISVGKERGYVTYEEMNNVLPTHLVSDDQLDDVMILFNKMDTPRIWTQPIFQHDSDLMRFHA